MSIPVIETLLPLPFGVVLALHPALDPKGASISIERTTDSLGLPDVGGATPIATVDAGSRTHVDYVGGPGPYWYRANHVRQSATPGPYTTWVKAVPTVIPGVLPNVPELTRVIYRSDITSGCPGTAAETDLREATLAPALGPGSRVRVTMQVQFAFTNNDKKLRLYLNATEVCEFVAAAAENGRAFVEVLITNIDELTTQYATGQIINNLFAGGSVTAAVALGLTEDMDEPFTLKVTGEHTNTADDVILEMLQVAVEAD